MDRFLIFGSVPVAEEAVATPSHKLTSHNSHYYMYDSLTLFDVRKTLLGVLFIGSLTRALLLCIRSAPEPETTVLLSVSRGAVLDRHRSIFGLGAPHDA